MSRQIDITGKQFGRWTALEKVEDRTSEGKLMWSCICSCGTLRSISSASLRHGPSTTCGCVRPGKMVAPFLSLYKSLLRRSNAIGFNDVITYDEFLEFTKINACHYCGGDLFWPSQTKFFKKGNGVNLDRKDAMFGYTKANVVTCCGRCNRGKGTWFTYDEWVQIGKLISTFPKRIRVSTHAFSRQRRLLFAQSDAL